jgi:hypothetical protein
LLDQQHAGPEQIDKAVRAGLGLWRILQLFDRMLKGGHALVGDAKDVKEVHPERLGLRVFIGSIVPLFGEGQRLGFDFVPGKGHGFFSSSASLARCWETGWASAISSFGSANMRVVYASVRRPR